LSILTIDELYLIMIGTIVNITEVERQDNEDEKKLVEVVQTPTNLTEVVRTQTTAVRLDG